MSFTVNETGVEPITLDEAKDQCYIPRTDTDTTLEALLNGFITAARKYAENRTWRQLIDGTVTLKLDDFPFLEGTRDDIIDLPRPPAKSVTSIKYIDDAGNEQTVSSDDYYVDTVSQPARIEPVTFWPTPDDRVNAVEVIYEAGYSDSGGSSSVPEDIKTAIKMMVKYLYDNRDSYVLLDRSGEYHEAPIGTNALLDAHSVRKP